MSCERELKSSRWRVITAQLYVHISLVTSIAVSMSDYPRASLSLGSDRVDARLYFSECKSHLALRPESISYMFQLEELRRSCDALLILLEIGPIA